jgi:hypothetical protein
MTTALPVRVSVRAQRDPALTRLRHRLRSMSDRPELLYDLMGFGPYRLMTITKDGILVARPRRSQGFDTLLGRISAQVQQRTAQLWLELTQHERALVLLRLSVQGIAPAQVGIVTEQVPCLVILNKEACHGR